ncbi:hypothetical protein BC835DRAFT_1414851 [Cytidiella melzeri]|nr:hypothetical protein BC835DRAFT_1414851 [Cytidiella melzeri]
MASEDDLDDTVYVDRSVQTSPTMESVELTPKGVDTTVQDVLSVSLALEGLTLSERLSDAPNVDEVLAEAVPSIETTARSFKRTHFPQRRPSGATVAPRSASTRIVSLPETVPEYSEKKTLRRIVKMRVVSLPAKSDKPTPDMLSVAGSPGSEQFGENILPDHDRPSRIRVCSNATDTPCTPSPPSSPESIVIIGDNSDDDWVSWARSPPRPIPALHGPSSLPYARCPSGAEGTIIEGQDNLPRVIWGLQSEDPGRARSETPQDTSNGSMCHDARKAPSRHVQAVIPPRFSQAASQARSEARQTTPVQVRQSSFVELHHQVPALAESQRAAMEYECGVPAHGPIDLSQLARPHSSMESNHAFHEPELASNRAYGTGDLRTHRNHSDLELDWQAYSCAQDSMRNPMLSSQSLDFDGLGDYIRPSGSSFSVSSLASSRSPIILDHPSQLGHLPRNARFQYSPLSSQNTPLHTPVTAQHASHRMSALEIAQQYRQQQFLQGQQPAMLPTPPNSSSPLWSCGFSPYQELTSSPEGFAIGPWSSASMSLPAKQTRLQTQDVQRVNGTYTTRLDAQGCPTATTACDRPGSRQNTNWPSVTANLTRHAPDSPFSSNAIDLALLKPARTCVPEEQRGMRTTGRSSKTIEPQASPTAPRPPLNTPLQTAVAKNQVKHVDFAPDANVETPLSPTSPNLGLLGTTRQHPRSVPLHRLIQRRLSSVPEEDSGAFLGNIPALSLAEQDRRRVRHVSAESKALSQDFSTRGPRFTHKSANTSTARYGNVSSSSIMPPSGRSVTMPNVTVPTKPSARPVRAPNVAPRGREAGVVETAEQVQQSRYRGRNGKKGRQSSKSISNGPERVDGGLTVRS